MSVICCRCGSANVSCEAMINPNTKEFIRYTDESFDYGWCDSCNAVQALTDTEGTKANIAKAFNEYKSDFKKEPLYASCQIVFIGADEPFQDVLIKLSAAVGDDDERIFFYCNGAEDLKSLTEFSANEFIVTEFYSFLKPQEP